MSRHVPQLSSVRLARFHLVDNVRGQTLPFAREEIGEVAEAWLVPLKVGSVENTVTAYSKIVGRLLPYTALQRFERHVARLFALTAQSERKFVEEQVHRLLNTWRHRENTRARFPEPADALAEALICLSGDSIPDGVDYVRARRPDAPIRLATVVPEDRQHYLRASFARWEIES